MYCKRKGKQTFFVNKQDKLFQITSFASKKHTVYKNVNSSPYTSAPTPRALHPIHQSFFLHAVHVNNISTQDSNYTSVSLILLNKNSHLLSKYLFFIMHSGFS
jgi:hypothetical protein